MSKIEITVSVDEEKFKTVDAYLKRKSMTFDDEVDKAIDALYSKLVPTAVKEYLIMMKEGPEAVARPRRKRHTQNNPNTNQSNSDNQEQNNS